MKLHPTESAHYRSARSRNPGRNHSPDYWNRRVPDRDLKSALELRYQVYCQECGFLSPDDYPDGVESDEHDDSAAHFYAYDADGELVGYVRLVCPDVEQRFPFQKHCTTYCDSPTLPAPGEAVEISRLMLRRDYRRLRGSQNDDRVAQQKTAIFAGERRLGASQVLLTLYRQMYAYSRANNISHWYAAMERPLARSLLRMNFSFKLIGPQTDYFGPVAPYLASLKELETQVGEHSPEMLSWLQQPDW